MNIWYLIVVLILAGFSSIYEINEKEVERILTTLSSDEMQGRKPGTHGIELAADFISDEFNSIGLSSLINEKSYKQNFSVNSTSVAEVTLIVNEVKVISSNYFFKLSSNSIAWSADSMPKILFVAKDDNFREKVGSALGSKDDMLVIIAESHVQMFERYHSYFSSAKMSLDEVGSDGANLVFILDDAESISDLSIEAKLNIEKIILTNVVGVIEGKRKNEMVLYSAHYDHLGVGKSIDGDSIYNGANDDASGVTAVIELARYFKSKGTPERTLVFAAFTAEEIGGLGSKYFSKQLNPDEIIAMLNIEMIGKESKEGLNSAWMTGWDKSNLGDILQKNLSKIDFKFFPDPYPDQNLFYRSDNATLARLGVPAHSISTTQIDIDKDYHQLSDEIGTMEITNITNTIKALAVGSQGIVDGVQTPTRVDPVQVRD